MNLVMKSDLSFGYEKHACAVIAFLVYYLI